MVFTRYVLINGESLWVNDNPELPLSLGSTRTHHVFYTTLFMQAVFPRASILSPKNREMQHCCPRRLQAVEGVPGATPVALDTYPGPPPTSRR